VSIAGDVLRISRPKHIVYRPLTNVLRGTSYGAILCIVSDVPFTYGILAEGALNLQDRKMTDKSVAGKNVEHLVLTFKNHHTKLINVHDLGVYVSSSQFS